MNATKVSLNREVIKFETTEGIKYGVCFRINNRPHPIFNRGKALTFDTLEEAEDWIKDE